MNKWLKRTLVILALLVPVGAYAAVKMHGSGASKESKECPCPGCPCC